ncbi:MAG: hypothetical protein JO034_25300 [Singulisphaera sp.]|nr:hypothetical protein [Singulisphaera sp.]
MSIEELKSVVSQLSASEISRFEWWFKEFLAAEWERLAGRPSPPECDRLSQSNFVSSHQRGILTSQ